MNLNEINQLNYAAAKVVQDQFIKTTKNGKNTNRKSRKEFIPKWKLKQMNVLEELRQDISRVSEFIR